MNSMAARVITELKAGGKSSTDIYLGSLGQFAHLQKENALQEVNWSGTFPWVTKENIGLHVSARNHLQRKLNPAGEGAEKIRGSDRSPAKPCVGGKVSNPALSEL